MTTTELVPPRQPKADAGTLTQPTEMTNDVNLQPKPISISSPTAAQTQREQDFLFPITVGD